MKNLRVKIDRLAAEAVVGTAALVILLGPGLLASWLCVLLGVG